MESSPVRLLECLPLFHRVWSSRRRRLPLGRLAFNQRSRAVEEFLVSWELDPVQGTRDKGLALGGITSASMVRSFGADSPGSLTYALMHHGELARYEAPYSLPLLFNEDEWRNGTQTAGYNRPPLKELLIQKVYHLNRSRYGLEHHTMFFFNAILQSYGAGAFRLPGLTDEQHEAALKIAVSSAQSISAGSRRASRCAARDILGPANRNT